MQITKKDQRSNSFQMFLVQESIQVMDSCLFRLGLSRICSYGLSHGRYLALLRMEPQTHSSIRSFSQTFLPPAKTKSPSRTTQRSGKGQAVPVNSYS